ncbi:MAG: glycosyltransferase family 25 protein [Pontibacterium sp.]
MIKLLDLVDAIYVINLPERVDRRRRMDSVLSTLNLSFNDERVHLFPAVKVADAQGFPSPGVRGCFLSHKTILEKARASGCERVLILEDDVEFATNTLGLLETLDVFQEQTIPPGFFYFGFEDPDGPSKYVDRRTQSLSLNIRPGRLVCAHAYIVSADIFDALIAHLDECLEGQPGDTELGPMDVDGAFNAFRRRYPDVLATVTAPQVAWQRDTHSDLHARRWHHAPMMRPVLTPLRRFKNSINRLRRSGRLFR